MPIQKEKEHFFMMRKSTYKRIFFNFRFPVFFIQQIQSVFGLRGRKIRVFEDAKLSKELSGQMLQSGCSLYVTPVTGSASLVPEISPASPVCCFANVEFGGKKATVLLENPRGCTTSPRELLDQVRGDATHRVFKFL